MRAVSKDQRPNHTPAPPIAIGQSTGLIYCMACGYLLNSDRKGITAKAGSQCIPNRLSLRSHDAPAHAACSTADLLAGLRALTEADAKVRESRLLGGGS